MYLLTRLVALAFILACATAGAFAQTDAAALTSLDRKVMVELSAVEETAHVVFHYRPGDFDAARLEEVVDANVEKFGELEGLLKMTYRGRVHVFLYRDVADFQKMTDSAAVALSTGTVSVHQPRDFRSVHELTHIFALQFPRDENAVTDGFAVEGLATTLAEVDQGVPIHSWAATYRSTSRLPDLVEFRRSWPEGALRGVHPYHVAGSFVGYLIERFGIEKVKRWYVNSTEAHMVFGRTFRGLERDWLAWLGKRRVEPDDRDHVMEALGLSHKPIPEAYAAAKGAALFDGKSLRGLKAEDPTKWTVDGGRLRGANAGPWTRLHTLRKFPANVGVRMKFRMVSGDAVQVRLNRSERTANEAVLARWATYLSLKSGGYAPAGETKFTPGAWNEVVLVNENGTGRLYLNGFLAIEKKDAFHSSDGTLGIGVEEGTLEVAELVAFKL